jgi:hypothetical protein
LENDLLQSTFIYRDGFCTNFVNLKYVFPTIPVNDFLPFFQGTLCMHLVSYDKIFSPNGAQEKCIDLSTKFTGCFVQKSRLTATFFKSSAISIRKLTITNNFYFCTSPIREVCPLDNRVGEGGRTLQKACQLKLLPAVTAKRN